MKPVHKEWVRIYNKYYPDAALEHPPPPSQPELTQLADKYRSRHQWTEHGGQAKFMALEPDSFETNEQGQPITSDLTMMLNTFGRKWIGLARVLFTGCKRSSNLRSANDSVLE
jgi:hypothetical protein